MAGHFLLSKDARNFNLRTVDAMTEEQVYAMFLQFRWNHGGKQVCPDCGAVEHHYVIKGRRQWRCKAKGCSRTFSATSGTKFADRKLDFKNILRGLVIFITNSKGISAPAFSNLLGVACSTGFVLLQKLRESLWQTRDLTPLSGTVHMDGAHFCGRPRKPNSRNKLTKKSAAAASAPYQRCHGLSPEPAHRDRAAGVVSRKRQGRMPDHRRIREGRVR